MGKFSAQLRGSSGRHGRRRTAVRLPVCEKAAEIIERKRGTMSRTNPATGTAAPRPRAHGQPGGRGGAGRAERREERGPAHVEVVVGRRAAEAGRAFEITELATELTGKLSCGRRLRVAGSGGGGEAERRGGSHAVGGGGRDEGRGRERELEDGEVFGVRFDQVFEQTREVRELGVGLIGLGATREDDGVSGEVVGLLDEREVVAAPRRAHFFKFIVNRRPAPPRGPASTARCCPSAAAG